MEFDLKLHKEDYLQFQLYTASQSPRIKKNRTKSLVTVVLLFLLLSYLFWSQGNTFLMWAFLFWVLMSLLFYPMYLRRHYRKHYEGFIEENYANKIGEKGYFKFENAQLFSRSRGIEAILDYSEFEKVVEISTHFFLYLKSGVAYIFPKRDFSEVDNLRNFLFQLCEDQEIGFSSELNWKWK